MNWVCSGVGAPSICVTDSVAGRGLRPEGRIEVVASELIQADRGAMFSAQPDKAARASAEPNARRPKPRSIRLVAAIDPRLEIMVDYSLILQLAVNDAKVQHLDQIRAKTASRAETPFAGGLRRLD